jgi:hypothetical protein
MQIQQNAAKTTPSRGPAAPLSPYAAQIAKLARFLKHHQQLDRDGNPAGTTQIIEVRRTDAELAYRLGISMTALERSFSELLQQNVIQLHGAHQIEILSSDRLSEFAKEREVSRP